jgi:sulfoquinovose isomerase
MRGGRQRRVTAQLTSPPEISQPHYHAYAIAYPTRRLGADLIDHGINFLWNGHRDSEYGGYCWDVGYDGPWDPTKQAYGHAFVLLVASSAKVAGHPGADQLITDISTIIRGRFWEEQYGAVAEEFTRDWRCSEPRQSSSRG